MTWRLCEHYQMHPTRWDRSNPSTPMVEESSISLAEWEKENPNSLKLPFAAFDAETWRDFDNPAFFGCIIVDRYGGLEDAVVGAKFTGEVCENTGKKKFEPTPHRWGWDRCSKHLKCRNKERMEKCNKCKRKKPKNYGKYTSGKVNKDERRVRFTRIWCWPDEVSTVLIPHLMEKKVHTIYAHNATVDLIALLKALEPNLYHPLMKFVQTDPDEFSSILFRGSKVLTCTLDIAPYFNKAFNKTYRDLKYNYKSKRFEPTTEFELKIIDSLGILPLSLGEIGEAIGFEKGETPDKFTKADHKDFQNNFSITADDIDYCLRDCEVLFRGLQMMWQTVKDLGYHGTKLPLTSGTLGSQMIARYNVENCEPKLYRKKEKSWRYATIVKMSDLDDIARLCLVGGRTQAFVREAVAGLIFGCDANSHYPSVMTDSQNSWPDFRTMFSIDKADVICSDLFQEFEGCIHVKWVRPEHDQLGLFCQRNDQDLLDWTLTTGERWITFPEYRKASEIGYTLTPTKCKESKLVAIYCNRLESNPFEDVIRSWYDERLKRKQAKDPSQFALKILLNSGGFGKFVEKVQRTMVTTSEAWAFMPDGWNFTGVETSKNIEYGYATEDDYSRADATANIMGSYITSYARLRMWEIGTKIGVEHLLYADTDSWKHTNSDLICPNEGTQLGQWSHEQTYDYWHSTRPKQYKYHVIWDENKGDVSSWSARVKGCSLKKAAEEAGLSWHEFCKQLDLNGVVNFEGVVGIKESWRSNQYRAGQWVKREKKIGEGNNEKPIKN